MTDLKTQAAHPTK